MPFIHIKSLPLNGPIDTSAAIEGLSTDFAEATGIGIEHITVTWGTLSPGCYAVGGKAALRASSDSHPVLVDLLAPDFNSGERVEQMLRAVASSLSEHVGVSLNNIFINYRQAHSGMVFDAGEIVRW